MSPQSPVMLWKRRKLYAVGTLRLKTHNRLEFEPRCLRQLALQGRIVCRTEHACCKFRLMSTVKLPDAVWISSVGSSSLHTCPAFSSFLVIV